jgi:hypothetical protein
MRPASDSHARIPTWVLLCLLPGWPLACTSQPTQDPPRRLDAPLTSGARLFDEFLSPRRIGQDVHELASRSGSLLAAEQDLRAPFASAGDLLGGEVGRVGSLTATTRVLTSTEVARLAALRHSPAWTEVDPGPRLGMLQLGLRSLPATLQLDRRMMGEPDDFRHRTDPADDHPEAGFVPRILRRILP